MAARTDSNPPTRLQAPLADDLQDAMFENDFKETARSISPTMPVDIRASPHLRHTGSPSPGPLSAATLHERRGRQSSQSLSARLFGGFTPPNTSFLSPTSDSFRANALPPTSASSGEGSPAQVTVPPSAKKSWANSIRSVTSTSSHQSNRGLSSWAGSLWSWNKSGRSRYFSDDEEEDEGQSDEDATPIAASSFTQHPSRKSRLAAESDKDKTIKGRPRTLSKSSSNSASTKSCDTTAATSFSSHAVTQAQSVDEEHSTSLRKSPSATSTLTIEGTDKADKLSSARKEGPARVLLARRPSALHPDAALTTHSVIAPVTTTSSPRASLSGEKGSLPTSTSILQSLASLDRDVEPTALSHEVPSHYRAVSESATYISRSSSQAAAKEVFRAPTTVSSNVTEWTYRLLDSFRGSPVPAILATVSTPVSAEMNRTGSKSPSTSRSISPRIPQAQSKAALSPATVLNDSTAKHVRLSVSSASSQDATFGSLSSHEAEEAMPLASSETQKQKGYIASARGTIGRALGLSSSPSSKVGSGSSGTIKKTGSSKARSNSLKAVIEPALTVPATFTSFSSPATVVRPNAPGASAKDHHPRAPPVATPLEMGTIVAPEAKPPTLSNDLADQMKNGPLVDRFGFVYDIKVGMKLLKEYRRKQETTGQTVISLDPPADVNVEDLREAIGPSPSATPGIETAMNSAALHLADDETLKPASGDTRSTSDSQSNHGGSAIDSSTTPQVPSNQSIRRLLNQLGEMNESVEQSQKEAWDRFIKRRRKKAHKPPKDDEVAIAAKARKKRTTFVEAPLSTVNNSLEDDSIDDQFADNLVGVASMGADKQDDKIFRNLVRSGIPIAYRPSVSTVSLELVSAL